MVANSTKRHFGRWSAIAGSLLFGIPVGVFAARPAAAQLNPCPSIFQEFGIQRPGCPGVAPIVPGQQVTPIQPTAPGGLVTPRTNVIQPPLPEARQEPVAYVNPTAGNVDIRLINQTGTEVNYEVIADTDERILEPDADVMLQGLSVPTTLAVFRPDGGLVSISTNTATDGMLEVTLNSATQLGNDENTLRIQEDGSVFLN